MSVLFIITDPLLPIALVILLGIVAGRTGMIRSEQSSVLADPRWISGLPSLLFVATGDDVHCGIEQMVVSSGHLAGLLAVYVVAFKSPFPPPTAEPSP
jgi:predicted permease